jgi:hypothetical protein
MLRPPFSCAPSMFNSLEVQVLFTLMESWLQPTCLCVSSLLRCRAVKGISKNG